MFTVLVSNEGAERLYTADSVERLFRPKYPEVCRSDAAPICEAGLVLHQGDGCHIHIGETGCVPGANVYVMNRHGKTVAKYVL